MGFINCPECGKKNISNDKDICPSCGFNIREFNIQSEKEHKNGCKKRLAIRIGIGIVLGLVIIIAISTISANQKNKSFQKEVDEFIIQWDGLIQESHKDSPNAITVDLYYKNLVSSMQNISEKYVQFDDKSKINKYLEEHTWKEQYERVMRYNEEHENREITQEFVEFYTYME